LFDLYTDKRGECQRDITKGASKFWGGLPQELVNVNAVQLWRVAWKSLKPRTLHSSWFETILQEEGAKWELSSLKERSLFYSVVTHTDDLFGNPGTCIHVPTTPAGRIQALYWGLRKKHKSELGKSDLIRLYSGARKAIWKKLGSDKVKFGKNGGDQIRLSNLLSSNFYSGSRLINSRRQAPRLF